MKTLSSLVLAIFIAGCGTTGTIDPAVQAQLTIVEQLALQYAAQYAAQHLGASVNSASAQASIANATAAIQQQAPKVSSPVIKTVVATAHKAKLSK